MQSKVNQNNPITRKTLKEVLKEELKPIKWVVEKNTQLIENNTKLIEKNAHGIEKLQETLNLVIRSFDSDITFNAKSIKRLEQHHNFDSLPNN